MFQRARNGLSQVPADPAERRVRAVNPPFVSSVAPPPADLIVTGTHPPVAITVG